MKYIWFIQSPAKYFLNVPVPFPRTVLSGHRLHGSFHLCKPRKLHITSYFNFAVQFSVLCCDSTAEGVLASTKIKKNIVTLAKIARFLLVKKQEVKRGLLPTVPPLTNEKASS